MKITKHLHACVELSGDGSSTIVIDPGAFTSNATDVIARASAVLITHEHFDHVDVEKVEAALASRPELTVWGPESVTGQWTEKYGDQVHAVRDGDGFSVAGLDVQVRGELHAQIHSDIPQVANVGYLIDGVYHPGDSYHVPADEVATLLVPTSGPWTKLGEAVDFVRAVKPQRTVQIHEIMLSEMGQGSTANFMGPDVLGTIPLEIVPPGQSFDV